MKRLALILGLVLMLALAACDTMGPNATQEVLPTDIAPGEESATVAPVDLTPAGEAPEEGSPVTAGADLMGVTWEWVSVLDPMGQTAAVDPARYTIAFNADGTAAVKADCNNATATYITDGVNLNIALGAMTLAACPEDTQDQLFLNSLGSAESYIVQDGELFITMQADGGTIIFRTGTGGAAESSEAPVLTGVTWEWVSTSTGAETITVVDPTRYTIVFNEDGTANIKADCNSVGATYTAGEDSSMTITLGPSTLVACPPDSQVDTFLAGLPNVVIYSFIDGDLVLDQPVDSGAMRFQAAGGDLETMPDEGDTLTGVTWEWVSTTTPVEEIIVADPTRYTIFFNEDGTAGIVADCNVGNAEYTTGDVGAISITLGVSTLAFCENSQDQVFRNGLASAANYFFQEGDLFIDMTADSGTMRFRAAGDLGTVPAEGDTLTGTIWQWVSTVTPVETITVADPTRYEITFNEDGTANIKADCNSIGATYTTGEDSSIAITLGPSTLVACPPDSQVDAFTLGLSSAAIYFFQDGNLFIDQFASAGTMQFQSAATAEAGGPSKGEPGATGELVGTTWQLNSANLVAGALAVADPSRHTITFNADGTANIQADCNTVLATYSTGEGGALTITPGASTLAFCGAGSLDQIFVGGLTNAMSYRIEGGSLIIDMFYESGSLVFLPAP